MLVRKRIELYKHMIKNIAIGIKADGKGIKDNFFVSENMDRLRAYMFMAGGVEAPWTEDIDTPHWEYRQHDKIIEWAKEGDSDAQFYLEICGLFNKGVSNERTSHERASQEVNASQRT
jgi:hypothetical protein